MGCKNKNSSGNKVVLVGTGMVGMSYAYSLLNQGACEKLVLIDINKEKAEGEAMDLNHGLAFAPRRMEITAGEYKDCKDADIVCITAGAPQLPGETRLDLLEKNTKILDSIIKPIMESGFNGIMLIASNPVDIMTHIAYKLSGLPKEKVIGSGTTLDTARLRYILGEKVEIDPRNVHAYVMGEHGDSQFVAWSHASLGVHPVYDVIKKGTTNLTKDDLEKIHNEVKNAAYEIINRKKATYYGIGVALTRVTKAILNNENSILTVSAYLEGQYGHEGVYIAVPSIVNRNGLKKVIDLTLDSEEQQKFDASVNVLKENIKSIFDK